MNENEFYPRTVLSGTGYQAGITVERGGKDGVILRRCGGDRPLSGLAFWGARARTLEAAIHAALR